MNKHTTLNQRGVVSIMVTMILMLVISLIVLGFAQVSRRNEREALDRQLSTQAYYAAETGINDVVTKLNANLITQANLAADKYKTDCNALLSDPTVNITPNLSSDGSVSYSCLLINSKPTSITYSTIAEQRAVSVPLNLNGNLSKLFFSWKSNGTTRTDYTTCSSSGTDITKLPLTWGCDYAMLQVDIVKPAALNAGSLSTQTNSYFLRPSGVLTPLSTSAFGSSTAKARLVYANCTAGTCNAELDFTGAGSGTTYSMRIGALYNTAENVQVTGNVAGGLPATFIGAQLSVDSTGKAQDELRRIQVRLPVTSSDVPPASVQSVGAICKQFVLGGTLSDPTATLAGLCNP